MKKIEKYTKKSLLLTISIAMMLLSCISCVDDNRFDAKFMATDDVIIANQVETNIKALRAIYEEVELISAKIETGIAIDVVFVENGWEHSINNALLSGKIIVEYPQNQIPEKNIKTVYCYDLKICYYPTIWLQLFGAFDIEDVTVNPRSMILRKISASEFGYNSDIYDRSPEITMNSVYNIQSNFNENKEILSVKLSGNSAGISKTLNSSYKHEIIKNLEPNISNFNIVDGTMKVFVEKFGDDFPVEIQYNHAGRTVKYRGEEQITLYNQ